MTWNKERNMITEKANKLAVQALKDFCEDEEITLLDAEDDIYVWHWFDDEGVERVRVNTRNHIPDGVRVMVLNLPNIEEWWQDEWDCVY
jgi:hypothetical protein